MDVQFLELLGFGLDNSGFGLKMFGPEMEKLELFHFWPKHLQPKSRIIQPKSQKLEKLDVHFLELLAKA